MGSGSSRRAEILQAFKDQDRLAPQEHFRLKLATYLESFADTGEQSQKISKLKWNTGTPQNSPEKNHNRF